MLGLIPTAAPEGAPVAAEDVVLPGGVLVTIEGHVVGVADWWHDLLSAGQHLRRGLLGGEHNALTRSLLGAPAGSAPGGPPAADREPVQHPRPWPVHPRG